MNVTPVLVAQSCPTLCNPLVYSLPDSSVHGISQARILEWVAISSSRGSFWPRDWSQVFCTAGRFFTIWVTRKAHHLCRDPQLGRVPCLVYFTLLSLSWNSLFYLWACVLQLKLNGTGVYVWVEEIPQYKCPLFTDASFTFSICDIPWAQNFQDPWDMRLRRIQSKKVISTTE